MPQYHFPVRDLAELELTAIGNDEAGDGYDYLELTGGVRVTSDNLVYLGVFFISLGTILIEEIAKHAGPDVVNQEILQIQAGLPFQEPVPEEPQLSLDDADLFGPVTEEDLQAVRDELAARRRHPSAPDIQGRDV